MIPAISDRSRAYVRSRATQVMQYQCRIERLMSSSYDEETLIATAAARLVIYTGVCRVWEVSGSSAVVIGDTDLMVQTTNLSTPWDAPIAKRDDEVIILAAPQEDQAMVSKRFQIQSYAMAGELRATRRYVVMGIQQR